MTWAGPGRTGPDRAAPRLKGVAHRTPVMTSRSLDDVAGARILLKAEHLQRTGSFKFRGAYATTRSPRSSLQILRALSGGNVDLARFCELLTQGVD